MEFPLSLWELSLWLVITTLILLVTSEIVSPYYNQKGLLINRRRLRNTTLTMGILVLATFALQIYEIVITLFI